MGQIPRSTERISSYLHHSFYQNLSVCASVTVTLLVTTHLYLLACIVKYEYVGHFCYKFDTLDKKKLETTSVWLLMSSICTLTVAIQIMLIINILSKILLI